MRVHAVGDRAPHLVEFAIPPMSRWFPASETFLPSVMIKTFTDCETVPFASIFPAAVHCGTSRVIVLAAYLFLVY